MLLESIQDSKRSHFKLELDIRKILDLIDLPKLEKALQESIFPLNNLKCLKLQFEFGKIEYNGPTRGTLLKLFRSFERYAEKIIKSTECFIGYLWAHCCQEREIFRSQKRPNLPLIREIKKGTE